MASKKSQLVNIRGTTPNDDPYYRYKMEQVTLQQQGIKYVFSNIDTICRAIGRDPVQIIKYMRKKFGASFEYKNGEASTTKKDITSQILQDTIYAYIEENVLCKKCKNPETEIINDGKKSYSVCKACAHKLQIR